MADRQEHMGDDKGKTIEFTSPSVHRVVDDDVIDVRFVIRKLVRWSWLIALATLLGILKGLWDMHNFRPAAIATMTVLPSASGPGAAGIGGGAGGLAIGGLAGALAGVGVGSAMQLTEFDRLLQATSTVTLARILQDRYGMMQIVFAAGWDAETETWIKPAGSKFEFWQRVYAFLNLPTWSSPNEEDLANYLGGSFEVEELEDTGFQKIEFIHEDPEMALFLLSTVYNETSELLRQQDLEESRKRIDYLRDRLANTGVIELRQALLSLLASEARQEMLLQGDAPFGGRIVEPPYISKYKTVPNHLLLVGVPGFMGFAVSCLFVVMIALYRNE